MKYHLLTNNTGGRMGGWQNWRIHENFSGIFPQKFMRISLEYFSGNSWEILRTWLPILQFLGNGKYHFLTNNTGIWEGGRTGRFMRISPDFFSRNFWKFLWNISQEIPEKLTGLHHSSVFSNMCLWSSLSIMHCPN